MSRLRNAWLALTNRLPNPERVVETKVVEKFVLVGSGVVSIYVASSKAWRAALDAAKWGFIGPAHRPDWHGMAFLSCAEAFAACGDDAEVTTKIAVLSGDKAYIANDVVDLCRGAKPKVAKGKKGKAANG